MNEIKLKGTKNIRDFGNTITKNGIIKEKRLIRSSSLDKLTQNDINKLVNEYHLSTIIDLRTYHEEEENFDVEIEGVDNMHIPIFEKYAPGISREKKLPQEVTKKIELEKMYQGMIRGKYLERISNIIKTIIKLEKEGKTVLFHCTEGKDRTGIIAAIILLILGADKEQIIEDYLYTNKVNKKKAYKYYLHVRITKHNKDKAENIKNLYLAKIEYIEAIFDTIEKDFKTTDNFLKEGLKLTKEEMTSLRKELLEPIKK